MVVGAGPVGLSLALGLARGGKRVLVFEKEATTSQHSRAPAIWPRTQEILAQLDALDPLTERGIVHHKLQLVDADHNDQALIDFPLEELADETAYPQLLVIPQSETERLLCAQLQEAPNVDILFSSELTTLRQDPNEVTATYRQARRHLQVRAPFLVGCDGAHSRVREALAFSFDGHVYDMEAALADVVLTHDRDYPFPRLTTQAGVVVGIRIDENCWRLILPTFAETETPLDARVRQAVAALFGESEYRTIWSSEFTLHRRISSSFVQRRIALAGDAAHLNSPVGGQGMNAGIQDSEALCTALLAALSTNQTEHLLTYEQKRMAAVAEQVNRFTDWLTKLLFLGDGRLVRPVLRSGQMSLRAPPLRRRFLRNLAMLEER